MIYVISFFHREERVVQSKSPFGRKSGKIALAAFLDGLSVATSAECVLISFSRPQGLLQLFPPCVSFLLVSLSLPFSLLNWEASKHLNCASCGLRIGSSFLKTVSPRAGRGRGVSWATLGVWTKLWCGALGLCWQWGRGTLPALLYLRQKLLSLQLRGEILVLSSSDCLCTCSQAAAGGHVVPEVKAEVSLWLGPGSCDNSLPSFHSWPSIQSALSSPLCHPAVFSLTSLKLFLSSITWGERAQWHHSSSGGSPGLLQDSENRTTQPEPLQTVKIFICSFLPLPCQQAGWDTALLSHVQAWSEINEKN